MGSVETERVSEWADKLAIQDLIYRYTDAVNRRDWDQFEAVWAPDAVWEVAAPVDIRAEGYAAVRKTIGAVVESMEFLVQIAANPVIALLGDSRAAATTTIHEIGRNAADGSCMVLYGMYYDQIVDGDQGWRFAHRRFQHVYLESEPLTGQTIIQSRLLS
jgi:ketosteroid isomerase-like protein